MMSITGDRHGGPQVDYTINPAVGFPMATGPEGSTEPVGHVLPAWDCITGQQAALGSSRPNVTAARPARASSSSLR